MDAAVKNAYHVEFSNLVMDTGGDSKYISKVIRTDGMAGSFLTLWNDVDEVADDLLPVIVSVLNGTESNASSDSEMHWIDIFPNVTKFYINGGNTQMNINNPDYEMPTTDFKKIVDGWVEFLQTPPLEGAKIG